MIVDEVSTAKTIKVTIDDMQYVLDEEYTCVPIYLNQRFVIRVECDRDEETLEAGNFWVSLCKCKGITRDYEPESEFRIEILRREISEKESRNPETLFGWALSTGKSIRARLAGEEYYWPKRR